MTGICVTLFICILPKKQGCHANWTKNLCLHEATVWKAHWEIELNRLSTQRFNLLVRINHHLCSFVTLIYATIKMPFWLFRGVMTSTVDFRCQRNTSFRLTWGIIVPRSWQPLWRKISAHSLLPAFFACHRAERPFLSRIRTSAKYWKREEIPLTSKKVFNNAWFESPLKIKGIFSPPR